MGIDFDKHLRQGGELKLGGDMFKFKPLDTEDMVDFLKLGKTFASLSKDAKPEEVLGKFDESTTNSVKNVINSTLKRSFTDDWKENQDELKQFGMKYFMQIIGHVLEISSDKYADSDAKKKDKIINRLNKDKPNE